MKWCVIDIELGEIIRLCDTKKEALEEVKLFKWCDKWTGENKKYIIEREDKI